MALYDSRCETVTENVDQYANYILRQLATGVQPGISQFDVNWKLIGNLLLVAFASLLYMQSDV